MVSKFSTVLNGLPDSLRIGAHHHLVERTDLDLTAWSPHRGRRLPDQGHEVNRERSDGEEALLQAPGVQQVRDHSLEPVKRRGRFDRVPKISLPVVAVRPLANQFDPGLQGCEGVAEIAGKNSDQLLGGCTATQLSGLSSDLLDELRLVRDDSHPSGDRLQEV